MPFTLRKSYTFNPGSLPVYLVYNEIYLSAESNEFFHPDLNSACATFTFHGAILSSVNAF